LLHATALPVEVVLNKLIERQRFHLRGKCVFDFVGKTGENGIS
jgi:hypothetical protein